MSLGQCIVAKAGCNWYLHNQYILSVEKIRNNFHIPLTRSYQLALCNIGAPSNSLARSSDRAVRHESRCGDPASPNTVDAPRWNNGRCYALPVAGAIRSHLGAVSNWVEPVRPNRYSSFFFFLFKQILDVHKFN
jgi:hypothetical protein